MFSQFIATITQSLTTELDFTAYLETLGDNPL